MAHTAGGVVRMCRAHLVPCDLGREDLEVAGQLVGAPPRPVTSKNGDAPRRDGDPPCRIILAAAAFTDEAEPAVVAAPATLPAAAVVPAFAPIAVGNAETRVLDANDLLTTRVGHHGKRAVERLDDLVIDLLVGRRLHGHLDAAELSIAGRQELLDRLPLVVTLQARALVQELSEAPWLGPPATRCR